MGHVVVFAGPREVTLVEEPEPPLLRSTVRVETLYSGISAGTELTAYRGTNPYLHRRWDGEQRLFVEGGAEFAYPLVGWGYEEVGRVVERARDVDAVRVGDVIWGTWGHRSGAVVAGDRAAQCLVPEELAPVHAVFARIGAVALNAVLDAEINIGETVAVFGLGVAGLIATQLATLGGVSVVAVDRVARRRELAGALGATLVVDPAAESPAAAVKRATGGRGADVSIELSGSYDALHEAVRATARNSRVVAAGFFQGGADALRLGEELHHNRIAIVASQISTVAPRLAHRWDLPRLEQTVMRLAAEGRLTLDPLVTHVLPLERAADAFRLLDERPDEAVQVVLDFSL